ncbi:MAG: hypothetical protein E6Q97_29195 [Desulfurellales bacterium]|nr:MAG: hypothetical protein E6Q97_29195 [Desulfurellales bacterium]
MTRIELVISPPALSAKTFLACTYWPPRILNTSKSGSQNLKQRVRNIQSGCPFDLQLWLGIKTPLASRIEPYLHKRLAGCALRGEWFKPSEADLDWLHVFFAETNKHIKEVYSAGMAKRSL